MVMRHLRSAPTINPILDKHIVPAADLVTLTLGISQSDPYIFVRGCGDPDGVLCDVGTLDLVRQRLYGAVPLLHQGDATLFMNGESATWTGIDNPFGYTAAQVVPIELRHIAWYFGSKGVVPVNSMTIKDHPLLTDEWFSTFDRFGPNGMDATTWGQLPNRPRSKG